MKTRNKLDAYYTCSKLTKVLVENVLEKFAQKSDIILEPCVGTGSIKETLWRYGYDELIEWDIDPTLVRVANIQDASVYDSQWKKQVDWVITNPPYTQPTCQQIIENSMQYARKGICMLLRLSYDEPCKERAKFLQETILSHQIIFNPRPRFRTDTKGSDNVTSAWFVWLTDKFAKEQAIVNTEKIYATDWNV